MKITRKGAGEKNPESTEKGIGSETHPSSKKRTALIEGIMILSATVAISACDHHSSVKKITDGGCKDDICQKDGSTSPDGKIETDGGAPLDGVVVVSEDGGVKPDGGGTAQETGTGIDGTTNVPDVKATGDDGKAANDDGSGPSIDGTTTDVSGDAIVKPDGNSTGDTIQGSDGTTVLPDGNTANKDGIGPAQEVGNNDTKDGPKADTKIPPDGPQYLRDLAGIDFGPSSCSEISTGTFDDMIQLDASVTVGGYVFTYTGTTTSGSTTNASISITCGGVGVNGDTGVYPEGVATQIKLPIDHRVITITPYSGSIYLNVKITVEVLPS